MAHSEHTQPIPRPGLEAIARYIPGKAQTPGVAEPVKLSANENPLGCSPKAKAAYLAAADALAIYPEGEAQLLKDAIAEMHGLDAARIVCGAGSDELLQLVVRGYAGPGDEVLYSAHGFAMYPLAALQVGATPVTAPERELTADVDALLAAVTERTRVVFLANPNNPTGTMLAADEIARLHQGLRKDTVLVLDGAYAEYVDGEDSDGALALARTEPNVIATRTFSKMHGLAALRLGWAYGPQDIIDVLHRLRGPFNVNAPAQAAGVAAVRDTDFIARSRAHNASELAYVSGVAAQLGLLAAPSAGNFVLLRFPDEPGRTAADADAYLRSKGYILRLAAMSGLPDCLRMTLGTSEVNRAVMAALTEFVNRP